MSCKSGWETELLLRAQRAATKSPFREPSDIPTRFKERGTPGRSDFLVWAKMPEITYSASPTTLYNMAVLRRELARSECYVEKLVESQSTKVSYSPLFYGGLVLAGSSVLFSLIRK